MDDVVCQESKGFGVTCSDSTDFQWWHLHGICIDKCARLVLKKGKIIKFDGILFPDGRVVKGLIEGTGYKYLGILQADQIRYTEMKEKKRAE